MLGGRVSVDITYPAWDWTLKTPVALPLSEPSTPQCSITLGATRMPVWTPHELPHRKVAYLYLSGIIPAYGIGTIYYRVLHNSVTVATGSVNTYGTPEGYRWVLTHEWFPEVHEGDTLECALWASTADVTWDWDWVQVVPSNVVRGQTRLLLDFQTTIGFAWEEPGFACSWSGGSFTGYYYNLRSVFEVFEESGMLVQIAHKTAGAMFVEDGTLYTQTQEVLPRRGQLTHIEYTPLRLRTAEWAAPYMFFPS